MIWWFPMMATRGNKNFTTRLGHGVSSLSRWIITLSCFSWFITVYNPSEQQWNHGFAHGFFPPIKKYLLRRTPSKTARAFFTESRSLSTAASAMATKFSSHNMPWEATNRWEDGWENGWEITIFIGWRNPNSGGKRPFQDDFVEL